MSFLKEIMMNKLKHMTPEQLMNYSKAYGFSISFAEAQDITKYIKRDAFNPFDESQHDQMVQDLAKITDIQTAKKGEQLFKQLIKSYGLEHLFD
ncbi:MAG TPA: DUF2624 family protein [Bacillota bacterium]